jgi:hypothetical protein
MSFYTPLQLDTRLTCFTSVSYLDKCRLCRFFREVEARIKRRRYTKWKRYAF